MNFGIFLQVVPKLKKLRFVRLAAEKQEEPPEAPAIPEVSHLVHLTKVQVDLPVFLDASYLVHLGQLLMRLPALTTLVCSPNVINVIPRMDHLKNIFMLGFADRRRDTGIKFLWPKIENVDSDTLIQDRTIPLDEYRYQIRTLHLGIVKIKTDDDKALWEKGDKQYVKDARATFYLLHRFPNVTQITLSACLQPEPMSFWPDPWQSVPFLDRLGVYILDNDPAPFKLTPGIPLIPRERLLPLLANARLGCSNKPRITSYVHYLLYHRNRDAAELLVSLPEFRGEALFWSFYWKDECALELALESDQDLFHKWFTTKVIPSAAIISQLIRKEDYADIYSKRLASLVARLGMVDVWRQLIRLGYRWYWKADGKNSLEAATEGLALEASRAGCEEIIRSYRTINHLQSL
jgi:hypothetical protein